MKKHKQLLTLLLMLASLVSTQGCASGEAGVSGPGFGLVCSDDFDCPGDLECSESAGQCVSAIGQSWSGVLRLIPPESGFDSLEEHFSDTTFEQSGPLNIELDRPITVTGRVYLSDNVLLTLSSAQVIVVPESGVEGLSSQIEAGTINLAAAGGRGYGAGFEFKALRNHIYDIYVHLPDYDNMHLPPYHVRRSFAPSSHSFSPYLLDWDIRVPAPEEYVPITGRLVSSPKGDNPVRGCKVFGWSETEGNVTSSAITDDGGRFTILAQPSSADSSQPYALWSRPTSDNEAIPEGRMAEFDASLPSDLGDIVVPGGSHPINVAVDIESTNLAIDGLVGSRVTLSRTTAAGVVLVERFIGDSPRTSFQVPEGDYLLTFITPPDSPWRTTQTNVAISAEPDVQTLSIGLEPKIPVTGTVSAFAGWPVSGARIRALRLPAAQGLEAGLVSRTSDTTTDLHGNWSMDMDVGEYIFIVDPPEGSGLPKGIKSQVLIPTESVVDITLAPALAITGTVKANRATAKAGTDEPIHETVAAEGVRVEFFWNQWPDGIPPVPLAHTITDAKGAYRLLLPAE